ncbi:MAG TPA: hypothetical protein VHB72_00900 [Candidatus Saccharimonadales bacterium]|nr:hypothetical protein [Candidatus Saccharimonadales bacterium]
MEASHTPSALDDDYAVPGEPPAEVLYELAAEFELPDKPIELDEEQRQAAFLCYVGRHANEHGLFAADGDDLDGTAKRIAAETSFDTSRIHSLIRTCVTEGWLRPAGEGAGLHLTEEGNEALTAMAETPAVWVMAEAFLDRSLRYGILMLQQEVNNLKKENGEIATVFEDLPPDEDWKDLQKRFVDLQALQLEELAIADPQAHAEMVKSRGPALAGREGPPAQDKGKIRLNAELGMIILLDYLIQVETAVEAPSALSIARDSEEASPHPEDAAFIFAGVSGMTHKRAAAMLGTAIKRGLISADTEMPSEPSRYTRAVTFANIQILPKGRKFLEDTVRNNPDKLETARQYVAERGRPSEGNLPRP